MTNYEYVKNCRQRLKERLVYIMGGKCCICGYNKCITALEFHHINPEEKDFTLGINANIGTEKAINEIKKCVLVCSNCHREIHADLINITKQDSTFSTEKAEEILKKIEQLKTHQILYCKKCGVEITKDSKSGLCPKCSSFEQRRVERPTRDELKDMIKALPFTQIAKMYGLTDNSIRKWCISYGLPSRKADISKISDDEWELI
jgi:hypothetical protein